MRTTRLAFAMLLVTAAAPSALAQGNKGNPLARKVDAIQAEVARGKASWKATKAALKDLNNNKMLRAALGAKNQLIVLGEREGAYTRGSLAYYKAMHLGLTEYGAYMPVKVRWKEQLVFGPAGLEVRLLQSVSKPTRAVIDAFQASLDAQFASKAPRIKIPDLKLEYEPFTDFGVVSSGKARVGLFGFGSTRLKAETWGHVTPAQVENAVQTWATAP